MYHELPRSFFSSSSVKTNSYGTGTLLSLAFSSTIFVGGATYFSKKVSGSSGLESLNTTIPIFLFGSTG